MADTIEQDRYRAFFEASTDAMLMIEDGKFVDCNKATLEMLGMTNRDEFFQAHPADLSPTFQPDGRKSKDKADEMIAVALETGSNRFNWVHTRKDGEDFPVEVQLIRIPGPNNKVILNVVWRDMSEQNRLQDALMEARLLKEAVEQSGASIVITNPEGKIEYVNPAFTEINGYTFKEAHGKTARILKSGFQEDAFYNTMWNTITSGHIWDGTLQNRRKSGALYWANLRISPVTNAQGNIRHFVGIETDITELVEARERAEQANQAKSRFLSSMSHELRTPLNSIIGFSQLLELGTKSPLSEVQRQQIGHIRDAGEYLLTLIDDILDLSKIESGKQTYDIQSTDPRVILDECLVIAQETHKDKNVRIFDNVARELPEIKSDPVRLKQVLLNLLSNAQKYNREGGKVVLECEEMPEGFLKFSVSDNGFGISKDSYNKIFQPFERIESLDNSIQGTGIGLSITKQIIEDMQGQIGVESEAGVGSTFWFELPLAYPKANEDEIETRLSHSEFNRVPLELPKDIEGLDVLYIEDNVLNRELMSNVFSFLEDCRLICAIDGRHGIELAREIRPDLILLDIDLPDINGFEVFEKLKRSSLTSKIPVIGISANALKGNEEKAHTLGFQDYIKKPINIDQMVRLISDSALQNENVKNCRSRL